LQSSDIFGHSIHIKVFGASLLVIPRSFQVSQLLILQCCELSSVSRPRVGKVDPKNRSKMFVIEPRDLSRRQVSNSYQIQRSHLKMVGRNPRCDACVGIVSVVSRDLRRATILLW
jgi:hypothetical protein